MGFIPGTVICSPSLDGLGVADLGALVLLSSPGLGVSFAEPLVREPNRKVWVSSSRSIGITRGGETCFSRANGETSQRSRFEGGEGKSLNMKPWCLKLTPGWHFHTNQIVFHLPGTLERLIKWRDQWMALQYFHTQRGFLSPLLIIKITDIFLR